MSQTHTIPDGWKWLLELEEDEIASAVPENVRELVELVGAEATVRLHARFEGQQLYVQRLEGAFRRLRDQRIKAEYDEGATYLFLAKKYGLSVNRVREILAEPQYQQVGMFG